jgi:uncharacterized glyoxalase superfamily protein PhnB
MEASMAQPDLAGMVVKDMAASLRFYRLLGLDIPANAESEDHVEYVTPGGFRIAWDTEALVKSFMPDWVQPIGQRISLAFKCASPAEVDALYQRLEENGYHGHKPPWDAFRGQRYAIVVDPDGSHVDLFAAL